MKMSDVDSPNYTDEQIEKVVKNYVNKWELIELKQFAYEEMTDYFCECADPSELEILMEDHGEKEN
jgi:hypothetical protein